MSDFRSESAAGWRYLRFPLAGLLAAGALAAGALLASAGSAAAASADGISPARSVRVVAAADSSIRPSTLAQARRELDVTAKGAPGSKTRRAVKAFQRDSDLPVTGVLDTRTLDALDVEPGASARAAGDSDDDDDEDAPTGGVDPDDEDSGNGDSDDDGDSNDDAVLGDDEGSSVSLPAELERIAQCESGGNPNAVSPNGRYRGKYQFLRETWSGLGGTGDPAEAPEAEQDRRALKLYRKRGTAPWGTCGRRA